MSRVQATPSTPPTLDERMNTQASAVLQGHSSRRGFARILPFLGPAFVASVAYLDPGNFATNIQGGAKFGYLLLWVILAANLMAMVVQNLSSKLGIATGRNLPETIRDRWPKPVVWLYWVQAELVAMATDLAEFLGAALAFHLLFNIPLLWGAVLTAIVTFGVLALQRRGFRPIEIAISAFLGVIVLAYLVQIILSRPGMDALGGFIPKFQGTESLYLAVGIIGATVMPHVIYLHSALTQGRVQAPSDAEKVRLARFNRMDVIIAMSIAGLVNMAMLASAAAAFHTSGKGDVADLSVAYQTLTPLLGGGAAIAFALALLASGLSSSAVGTMAGQVVMQGFVGFRIPLVLRRILTMLPAFAVIIAGLDPTATLVLSQVVLSFGIPFALVPLLLFTARRDIMGVLVNSRPITVIGWGIAALIIGLNVYLLSETLLK
ncbi:Nramp family divalent metal transporter [Deinococcus maricopensis]|uniref:Divalent metal cation transporter MntH n=1 Tax=Deinococcus maricopensis (strain DSM 21211 / LMG 22137 / NRRL B-23946 / LB-34) TaxID=709986 RepID=E8UAV7_DEIML|nr:Nramp family divalent metal transporter [Deinococcus maricopensis]ADV68196.1 Manganese transport protein mntH [Deinococcus maricopensis DSM 21211]